MRFCDLSPAEQSFEVAGALAPVLLALDRVTPTSIVTARVCRALNAWQAHPLEVSGYVLKAAQAGHPQARQDGETFKRWGKPMRRWQWYPLGDRLPSPSENKTLALAEAGRPYSLQNALDDTALSAGASDVRWGELALANAGETWWKERCVAAGRDPETGLLW